MGVCYCSMFCCTLLYVHSSFAIILMGKRKLVVLLSLSSWCLVMVVWLFLAVPWVCLLFVIVAFPDHTHLCFVNCPQKPFQRPEYANNKGSVILLIFCHVIVGWLIISRGSELLCFRVISVGKFS